MNCQASWVTRFLRVPGRKSAPCIFGPCIFGASCDEWTNKPGKPPLFILSLTKGQEQARPAQVTSSVLSRFGQRHVDGNLSNPLLRAHHKSTSAENYQTSVLCYCQWFNRSLLSENRQLSLTVWQPAPSVVTLHTQCKDLSTPVPASSLWLLLLTL